MLRRGGEGSILVGGCMPPKPLSPDVPSGTGGFELVPSLGNEVLRSPFPPGLCCPGEDIWTMTP